MTIIFTPRAGIPVPDEDEVLTRGNEQIYNLGLTVDGKLFLYTSGSNEAARPVSTIGTPGVKDRYFYNEETGELQRDTGTGWVTVNPAVAVDGLPAVGTARTLGTGAQQAAAGNDPRFNALGAVVPSYKSGDYINPPFVTVVNQPFVAGQAYFTRVMVPRAYTIDRIAATVTAGAASTTLRMGIYTDGDGRPKDLVIDGGTVAVASAGDKAVVVAQALTPGFYWVCAQIGGAGGDSGEGGSSISMSCLNQSPAEMPGTGPGARYAGFQVARTGPLPATAPALTAATNPPCSALRVV